MSDLQLNYCADISLIGLFEVVNKSLIFEVINKDMGYFSRATVTPIFFICCFFCVFLCFSPIILHDYELLVSVLLVTYAVMTRNCVSYPKPIKKEQTVTYRNCPHIKNLMTLINCLKTEDNSKKMANFVSKTTFY